MNISKLVQTIAIATALSSPLSSALARTQKWAQKIVDQTSFGLLVLKWQSIDPSLTIPEEFSSRKDLKNRSIRTILEAEIPGGCSTYGTWKILTPHWKLIDSESPIGEKVFDIMTLEKILNWKAKENKLPLIKADGRMTQETVNLMLKIRNCRSYN
jgi:hypothetical protein